MKLFEKKALLGFLVLLFILSPSFQTLTPVFAQVNLVEEEDFYKIYSGKYYNIIISKTKGPEISFQKENFGNLKLRFTYLSEYYSPSTYLSSLDYLTGKAYSLNYINWKTYGVSEPERAYVNMTRNYLDRNASLTFSVNALDSNRTINGYEIQPLETTYLELVLANWTFSSGTNGLAFRVLTFLDEPDYYERLGPFVDIEKDQYVVLILGANYAFEFRFNQFITIFTKDQTEEAYFSMFFVNYNIAIKEHAPADFWISIPFRTDIVKMLLTFLCKIYPIQTETTNGFTISAIIISFSLLIFTVKRIRKQKKQGGGKR